MTTMPVTPVMPLTSTMTRRERGPRQRAEPCRGGRGAKIAPPYGDGVIPPTRSAALRWVLMAALVFGLIGMHNLVDMGTGMDMGGPGPGPMASAPAGSQDASETEFRTPAGISLVAGQEGMGPSGQSPGHPVQAMHMCLAVLGHLVSQLAGLVLTALLLGAALWWAGGPRLPHPRGIARAPDRPPRTGRLVLASVCVLRL
ncbi:MAG TPA: hypothetical protein VFG87_16050 [Amycolatopsis sp.]|nr:hypothetical protein [Amycolatopsis sp.]